MHKNLIAALCAVLVLVLGGNAKAQAPAVAPAPVTTVTPDPADPAGTCHHHCLNGGGKWEGGTCTAPAGLTLTADCHVVGGKPRDTDGDGIPDAVDNCPTVARAKGDVNPRQDPSDCSYYLKRDGDKLRRDVDGIMTAFRENGYESPEELTGFVARATDASYQVDSLEQAMVQAFACLGFGKFPRFEMGEQTMAKPVERHAAKKVAAKKAAAAEDASTVTVLRMVACVDSPYTARIAGIEKSVTRLESHVVTLPFLEIGGAGLVGAGQGIAGIGGGVRHLVSDNFGVEGSILAGAAVGDEAAKGGWATRGKVGLVLTSGEYGDKLRFDIPLGVYGVGAMTSGKDGLTTTLKSFGGYVGPGVLFNFTPKAVLVSNGVQRELAPTFQMGLNLDAGYGPCSAWTTNASGCGYLGVGLRGYLGGF